MSSQPPTKKLKMTEGPGLHVARLTKHAFTLPEALSPGALSSCRVAVAALPDDAAPSYEAFLASGAHVYALSAPRSAARFHGSTGKEGVSIPAHGAPGAATQLAQLAHRAEVQELRLVDGGQGQPAVLAAADCYGRATLAHLRRGGDGSGGLEVGEVQQCQPAGVLVEAGWAGVAVAPGQPSQAAVARHFAKDVTLFDHGMPLRSLHSLYRPNALALLSSRLAECPGGGPLVAVAEGPQVSLWDARGGGCGARVATLAGNTPHAGALLALAAGDDGGPPLLAAAGADRSVLVWDARRWTAMDRWTGCGKYELTALHLSTADPRYCYVGGLDYEVVCGDWGARRQRAGGGMRTGPTPGGGEASAAPDDEARPGQSGGRVAASFRGDSRWAGLAKAAGQDLLAGVTQTCQLYVAELAPGGRAA